MSGVPGGARARSSPARSARAASSRTPRRRSSPTTRAATPSSSGSCPKCDPVSKVTIISRGMARGYTMALPQEDRYLQSKTEFEDKIAGMLGGNVAERLVFGDTTTGASNDIEKATDLARRMVTEFGMSDRLGPARLRQARRARLPRPRDRRAAQLLGRGRQARSTRRSGRSSTRPTSGRMDVLTTHRDKLDDARREARRRGDASTPRSSRRSSPTCRRRSTLHGVVPKLVRGPGRADGPAGLTGAGPAGRHAAEGAGSTRPFAVPGTIIRETHQPTDPRCGGTS